MSTCLPASQTKHLPLISHPLPRQCIPSSSTDSHFLRLKQISSNRGAENGNDQVGTGTTGTTLWLGGQLMSCYIAETLSNSEVSVEGVGKRKKRVLELGGGIGYLSLVLVSLGYDITTTDIAPSLQSVLMPNIELNSKLAPPSWGQIRAKSLDWFDYLPSSSSDLEHTVEKARNWMEENEPEPLDSYDMIITTDTLYSPSLTLPLLYTLRSFSLLSQSSVSFKPPPILVALEQRDPTLITSALSQAKKMGFEVKKIAQGRIAKCLDKSGWGWNEKDWEGVEVWKWRWVGKEEVKT